jgi:hypothetical protein
MADTPHTPPAPTVPAATGPAAENAAACREQCRERLDDLRAVRTRRDDPATPFEELQELDEEYEPLDVEERRQLKILLSWGGPSDGFVLTYDRTGTDLIGGTYFHADWFAHAEQPLSREEAELVADVYLHGQPAAYLTAA